MYVFIFVVVQHTYDIHFSVASLGRKSDPI